MQPLRKSAPLDYIAIQDGLLAFLREQHGYVTAISDYSLTAGFGAAVDGTAIAVCGEFRAQYPAYALFAAAHHGGHGQHIRARDHARMIELLELSQSELPELQKQQIMREVYEQDREVSCIGLGLLSDAWHAGALPIASQDFEMLIDEMHDYYLHDCSEFVRCMENGVMPKLTHTPQQTPRHPWVQDLILEANQPVLPPRQLSTALVFHVTNSGQQLDAASDRVMRSAASEILNALHTNS